MNSKHKNPLANEDWQEYQKRFLEAWRKFSQIMPMVSSKHLLLKILYLRLLIIG
jgi:hypothetical protein